LTANKVYYHAFVGGSIKGVQMRIQNISDTDITCSSTNGVYYTFDGRDYQILDLGGVTIPAGTTIVHAEDKVQALIPNHDIKIMVDTAGLVGCLAMVDVTWEVA